jgi:hypothetical protein
VGFVRESHSLLITMFYLREEERHTTQLEKEQNINMKEPFGVCSYRDIRNDGEDEHT